MSNWTPYRVRQEYLNRRDHGHFFDDDTMRFFGDTMDSYACCIGPDGSHYMYRKPSATVNVFGRSTKAGRQFFNCWLIVRKDDGIDLDHCDDATTSMIYEEVTN